MLAELWSREVALQGVEAVVPLVGEYGEELLGESHRSGAQPVADSAALAGLGLDQAGVGHEGEVLGDRLPADRQARREVGNGGRPVGCEGGENSAAGRVRKGDEDLLGHGLDVSRHRGDPPAPPVLATSLRRGIGRSHDGCRTVAARSRSR